MWRNLFSPTLRASIGTVIVLSCLSITLAQVRESTNYQIQSDSINLGGGLSSSTNYSLESTAGEVGTGESDSTSYSLRAGYQQMQEVYIAITNASDVSLPSIAGVTGGTSNGSTTVTVTTDSPSGYELTIEAENSPAMQKGVDSIADYVPAGAPPDFAFLTSASQSHLGYTPKGVDVVQRFRDTGVAPCNVGSLTTAFACWDGLSTTPETISSDTSPNHPQGATTTIFFRVEIGNTVIQPEGLYTATTTLTALPL